MDALRAVFFSLLAIGIVRIYMLVALRCDECEVGNEDKDFWSGIFTFHFIPLTLCHFKDVHGGVGAF